ncbi:MAG TPA: hypothetical protein VJ762_03565 [Sphingobium sp.]|nr:hypothetical protein [Sphingobium sp.]
MKQVKIAGGSPSQDHAPGFDAGGLVGAIHQAMEVRLDGRSAVADWKDFSDPLSGGERFIQALSRTAGIVALIGGVAATLFALAQLF